MTDAVDLNTTGTSSGAKAQAYRFAVLEDSYANLRVIVRTCQELNYQINHFSSVEEALEALENEEYNALIVSDTMGGGPETCQATIRRVRGSDDQIIAAIPILVVSTPGDAARFRALKNLGATAAFSELTHGNLSSTLSAARGEEESHSTLQAGQSLVLLMEDSYNLTSILTHTLTQSGRLLNHVTTPEQAIAELNAHSYDLVILSENNKPAQLTTAQVISHIRSVSGSRASLPKIWVLTTDASPEKAAALREAGIARVLDKRDPIRLGNVLFSLLAGKANGNPADAVAREARATTGTVRQSEKKSRNSPTKAEKATTTKPKALFLRLGPASALLALCLLVAGALFVGRQYLFIKTPVEAVAVKRGTIELTAAASGTVVSKKQVDLTPTQPGQLYLVYATEGELVRKGETLAALDSREATVNVRRAEAQVFRYRAELKLLEQTLLAAPAGNTGKTLSQAASENEANKPVLMAKLGVAEQELNATRVTLDRLRIVAPFAGAITRSWAVEGKWVEPGTPIFTLADITAREVEMSVPIDIGQSITADLPVRMFSPSNGENWLEKVSRVVTDRGTGAGQGARARTSVYTTLGEEAITLQFGQRVLAKVVTEVESGVIIAPLDALVLVNGRNFVTVVSDGRALLRPVELGIQNGREVAIRAGLNADEVVVTSHVRLEDGQRLSIVAAAVPAATPQRTAQGKEMR